ncbi:MAG: UbiA family prenyltransferase [Paludibacteraceae bacterium]|nr:UbiA family prenyltransferase [Paludibacteraceae bacterium]
MAYIKLLRLHILLIIALAQLILHYFVTTHIVGMDYAMPTLELSLIIGSTVLIAAGGFVINDYYDMRIDEINHPLTRLVGNEISKNAAMNLYIVLCVAAVLCSAVLGFITQSVDFCFILVTVVGLLWFYSSSYKRILIVGNLIISLSAALIPFIMALFEGRAIMRWWMEKLSSNGILITDDNLSEATPTINYNYEIIAYFSLFVFAVVFIHEIVRNLYEERGEREMECHTIPIVFGQQNAKYTIYLLSMIINTVCIVSVINHLEELQLITVSYYICSILAFSIGLCVLVKNAEFAKDYKICLLLTKLILISGIAYSFIYAYLNPNDWVSPV